jgi:hypothetical protein
MNNDIFSPEDGLIFMKVGVHASEPFDKILERKKREYDKTGMMFWGYGGGTCHPINQVRPFALEKSAEGKGIFILMNEIDSKHIAVQRATEYSIDGIEWQEIPKDIDVLGSRYALVLDELVPGDLDLNLSQTRVAIGNSRGKIGGQYIQGRIDKACLELDLTIEPSTDSVIRKVSYVAKLKDPFAVVLR